MLMVRVIALSGPACGGNQTCLNIGRSIRSHQVGRRSDGRLLLPLRGEIPRSQSQPRSLFSLFSLKTSVSPKARKISPLLYALAIFAGIFTPPLTTGRNDRFIWAALRWNMLIPISSSIFPAQRLTSSRPHSSACCPATSAPPTPSCKRAILDGWLSLFIFTIYTL